MPDFTYSHNLKASRLANIISLAWYIFGKTMSLSVLMTKLKNPQAVTHEKTERSDQGGFDSPERSLPRCVLTLNADLKSVYCAKRSKITSPANSKAELKIVYATSQKPK